MQRGPWFGGQQGEDFWDSGGPSSIQDSATEGGDSGDADSGEAHDGDWAGTLTVDVAYSPELVETCAGTVQIDVEEDDVSGTGSCVFPDDGAMEFTFVGTAESGTVASGDDTWTWSREELDGSLLVIWSGPDGDGNQHDGQFRLDWD